MEYAKGNERPSSRTSTHSRAALLRMILGSLLVASACFLGLTLLAAGIVALTPRNWEVSPPDFAKEKPAVGEAAPDFILRDPDGRDFHLAAEAAKQPVVIEFGSFT
jgi:hypothetical protein